MLSLTVLGDNVHIQCTDPEAQTLLALNYGQMQGHVASAALHYTVGKCPDSAAFFITRQGQDPLIAEDPGAFLFCFEKDLTIMLQKRQRGRFYVVHSAVLAAAGKAFMLVGASGSGKSLTTWALLHHGFRYLSDELAPVDLNTLEAHPYPHALCLKSPPPDTYPLPQQMLATSRALYIPVHALPSGVGTGPVPLAAVFFVRHDPDRTTPAVRPISKAEAGARLFVHALNPLAHPADGLDGAMEVVTHMACFELLTATLPATCTLVKATLDAVLS
jgi:hypothetical protein